MRIKPPHLKGSFGVWRQQMWNSLKSSYSARRIHLNLLNIRNEETAQKGKFLSRISPGRPGGHPRGRSPGSSKWRFAALRIVHSQDIREIGGPDALKTRLKCTCHEIALSVTRQTCTWNCPGSRKLREGPRNLGQNEHVGTDIHDLNTRTSISWPRGGAKNFGQKTSGWFFVPYILGPAKTYKMGLS